MWWWVVGGGWWVVSGGWWVVGGGWWVVGGGWVVGCYLSARPQKPLIGLRRHLPGSGRPDLTSLRASLFLLDGGSVGRSVWRSDDGSVRWDDDGELFFEA